MCVSNISYKHICGDYLAINVEVVFFRDTDWPARMQVVIIINFVIFVELPIGDSLGVFRSEVITAVS